MKKTFRSVISLILTLAIMLTALPMAVFATEDNWTDSINTDFDQNSETNDWEEIERAKEVILRNPYLYEEIDGSDLKGAEVAHDQNSRTYLLEDGTYLTRYFDDAIMYEDENGDLKDVDNTLVSDGNNYVNADNAYNLTLPKNGEGISVDNKGYTLRLIPQFCELKNAVVQENAVRYNNVCDGVDLQYTANGNNVKEDIILNKPIKNLSFSYAVDCDGLSVSVSDNILYAYEKDNTEPVFSIKAPFMTDNSGNVCQAVTLSFEDGTLTVSPDSEWIHANKRAFPIVIDPTIVLDNSNIWYCLVENGVGIPGYLAGPNTQHIGNPYLYAGFEQGNLTGIAGLTYGETRSYIKINQNFTVLPNGTQLPSNAIISAKLKAYKYTGSPADGAKVYCQIVTEDWHGSTKCWNTKPTSINFSSEDAEGNQTPNYAIVSGGQHWVEWDISGAIRYWVNGGTNYGLALVPEYENQGAVCFSGPGNEHGGQEMYFDISWTVPNAIDENLPLNAPVINLRPLTETNASGKQNLTGVFADGEVRPTFNVNYRLNDVDSGVYANADYGRIFPDSNLFNGVVPFTIGYTGLYKSNWQSKLFRKFDNNVLYHVYATATDGKDATPEGSSDSFIVYQFTDQDTLPYIADFYGVSLDQIIADNKTVDYLGFPGNTFFIRNPKKNATVPYSRPDNLTDQHKLELIYAALGRGQNSEFDREPINVNIGNFYFESTDAVSKEYNGTFTFSRSYNSIGSKGYCVFGNGWSFAYAQKLTGKTNGDIVYTTADGKQLVFKRTSTGYDSPFGYHLTLKKNTVKDKPGETSYTLTDPQGTVTRFNCYGLLESITDRNGFATRVQYDGKHHISGILTASGRQYNISTNADGQIVSVTLPNEGVLKYEYKNGNLVKFTNADNDVVEYKYNTNGQMTEWYDGNHHCVVKNEYDAQGRVVKQTDAMGVVSTFSYGNGTTTVTDGEGHKTVYYYDSHYQTTKVEGNNKDKQVTYQGADVSSLTENGIKTVYEYDASGNVIKATRSDGAYREISYDSFGNATRIREYDGTVTVNEYDAKGNLLKTTKPNGSTLVYTYDQYGQVTSLTDGNGNKTAFVYDGLTKMTETDAEGHVSYCYYDAMGNFVSEIDANGNEIKTIYSKQGKNLGVWKTGDVYEQYLYDGNGNCIEVVDAEGYKTILTYDSLNRVVSASNPLGGKITYQYDKNGNKVAETNTLGNTTRYSYDNVGRLISSADALGRKTTYVYFADGRIKSVSTPDGNTTEYEYDTLGQLIKTADRSGAISYAYDLMGRVTKTTYVDGSTTSVTYDKVGNIVSATAKNGLVTSYSYDKNGNLLETTDSLGKSIRYAYDKIGNLVTATDALGQTVRYSYDAASRLASQTDALGGVTKYTYDSVGNVTKIVNPLSVEVSFTYDKNGNRTSMKDGNGNVTKYHYDGAGDLLAVVDALGHTTSYSYDTAQQLVGDTDAVNNKTSYSYDALGRVNKTTDPGGYASEMKYDSFGNMVSITAPDGSETKYTYNEKCQLVKAELADGLVTEYAYDISGNVIREWDNAGNVTESSYDVSGNLLSKTDAAGRKAEYTYDLYGNLVKTTDFVGNTTEYEYDILSRLVSVTDSDGRKTTYLYDANRNVLSTTEDDGVSYTYVYDAASQLVKTTDPLNNETAYAYDNNGNILSVTDAKGGVTKYSYSSVGTVTAVTDALGHTNAYEYDAADKVIKTTTAEGNVTEYLYDGRGNVIKTKNPLGHVSEYTYDASGNLVKAVSPRGAETTFAYNHAGLELSSTSPNGAVTENSYALDGKLLSQTQPNGLKTTYEYDNLGRITKVYDSTGVSVSLTYNAKDLVETETTHEGAVTKFGYDEKGRMTSVTDAAGAKTEYAYDNRGNLISVKSPAGAETAYSYDALNRVSKVTQSLTAPIQYSYDPLGNVIGIVQGDKTVTTEYDAIGNTVSVTNALGNSRGFTYDKDNRMLSSTDFAGAKSAVTYDGAGNILTAINALGAQTQFAYDSDGNVTKMTDAIGNTTEYRYDLAGNMTAVKSPLGTLTEYTYDKMGNMTEKKSADGQTTAYGYDLHNNLVSVTSPDGTVEEFIYDISSRLQKAIKPDGTSIEYNYDNLNKLLSKTYSDDTESVTYGYDTTGRRVSMKDESGETSYAYDVLGRITSVTDGLDHTVKYGYDEYGRLADISYPDGRTVSYTYDLADNLLTVDDSTGGKTEYTYDANGKVLSCTRSDGSSTAYIYDLLGQVVSVQNTVGGNMVSEFTYTYDENGRIVTEKATQDGSTAEKTFVYDAEGQLTEYTEVLNGEASTTKYGYSVTGNRMAVTKGADKETVVYEYDDNGKLIGETSSKDGRTNYTYDDNGNLIKKTADGETYTYAYDVENRLTAVREGGALLMAASYDGDGNRTFQLTRQIVSFSIDKSAYGNDSEIPGKDATDSNPSAGTTPFSGSSSDNPKNDASNLDSVPTGNEQTTKTYYEKVYADPADTIFWYGFGQGALQFLGGVNTAISSFLSDMFCHAWDAVTGQYTLVLHSEAEYSNEDIDAMRRAGLSEKDIDAITGNATDISENTLKQIANSDPSAANQTTANAPRGNEKPVSGESVVIPQNPDQGVRIDYELSCYVNDINTSNEQVLMTYGRNESEKTVYTYGIDRIAEDDLQTEETSSYLYDGRGSVVQTAIAGEIDLSITYDPFGDITSGVDANFVGFAYNGEETNQVTGLQYLRARYYDSELGSFLTIDSYLGSLTDVTTQNRYTYANNDPVNNIDPSGHYSVNTNGTKQYYQSTGLNDLRDYMTAAGLWAGEVQAQNAFNALVYKAKNTSFMNYQSISGISQATAYSYVNNGIAKAGQVSMNYGCSVPTVPNASIAKFESNVNVAKNNSNAQISQIKAQKKVQYDEYQAYLEYLRQLELARQMATETQASLNNSSNNVTTQPFYQTRNDWWGNPYNSNFTQVGTIQNPWGDFGTYKGVIHNVVVNYLSEKHNLKKEVPVGGNRYDLYNPTTKEIWEVKPISYINPGTWRDKSLDNQLKKYLDDGTRMGHPLGNDTITYGEYTIHIYSEVPAKIYYTFERERRPEEVPVPVPAPETQKEKSTKSEIDWWNLTGTVAVLGGAALAVGTIVEDVLTYGTGILDDAPSFAAAGATIASGWNQLVTFFSQVGGKLAGAF